MVALRLHRIEMLFTINHRNGKTEDEMLTELVSFYQNTLSKRATKPSIESNQGRLKKQVEWKRVAGNPFDEKQRCGYFSFSNGGLIQEISKIRVR